MRNLSISLFEHEMIKTTLAKARELRRVAEPLITLAKTDTVANRRLAFNRLRNKAAVGKLFNELGPRFRARPGGYARVLKMGFRAGDSAPMALVELLDSEADTAPEAITEPATESSAASAGQPEESSTKLVASLEGAEDAAPAEPPGASEQTSEQESEQTTPPDNQSHEKL